MLDEQHNRIIADVMEQERVSCSDAIRYIIRTYASVMVELKRRGVQLKERPASVELEFPR